MVLAWTKFNFKYQVPTKSPSTNLSWNYVHFRDEIKSSGKFAILYLYKIGGGRGSGGTSGKFNVQYSIFA